MHLEMHGFFIFKERKAFDRKSNGALARSDKTTF